MQIHLFKINKIVLCYGTIISLDNKEYSRKIPNEFKPKTEIAMSWQSIKSNSVVATSTIRIKSDGTIYTNYPYKEDVVIGFFTWETI